MLKTFAYLLNINIGFRHQALGNLKPIGEADQLIEDLLANIRAEISSPSEQIEQVSLPTLLYFSAYRDIEPISTMERTIIEPRLWGYYYQRSWTN